MRLSLLAAAAVLGLSTLAAHADPITFTYEGASFILDSTNLPTTTTVNSIVYANVPVTVNGQIATDYVGFSVANGYSIFGIGTGPLIFYNSVNTRSFGVSSGYIVSGDFFSNQSLYSGSSSSPTFILGTYTGDLGGTLTIADPLLVSSTPEPSAIALLGTGMTLLAGVARRRFV